MLNLVFPYAWYEIGADLKNPKTDYMVLKSIPKGYYEAQIRLENRGMFIFVGIGAVTFSLSFYQPFYLAYIAAFVLLLWTIMFAVRWLLAYLQCRVVK